MAVAAARRNALSVIVCVFGMERRSEIAGRLQGAKKILRRSNVTLCVFVLLLCIPVFVHLGATFHDRVMKKE